DRALREHRQLDARMAVLDGLGNERRHGQRGRYDTERKPPGQRALGAAQRRNLLLQRRPVVEDSVRPPEDALTLCRKAVEALAALDDRHAEFLLELADAPRKRRLRDVARLGRT